MAENNFPNEFWHNEVEHTVCNVEEVDIQYYDVTLTADSGYKFNNEDMPLLVSDGLYNNYDEHSDGIKAKRFNYLNATTCQLLYLNKRDGNQASSTYIRGTVLQDSGGGTGFPTNFIMNIHHVKDNGSLFDNGTWKVALKCEDGWRFTEAPKVTYLNEYEQLGKVPLNLNEDGTQATEDIENVTEDTEITFDGETTDQETEPEPTFTITNNVPNTTATSDPVNPTDDKCVLTLTADKGYRIKNASVQFMTLYEIPNNKDFEVATDGHTATCEIGDVDSADLTTGVTLTGETASEGTPGITVINNITNTLKEVHTYDGDVATITVESEQLPVYRFIAPKASYKSTDGQQKTVDMEVEVLSYYSLAKVTITDLDPTKPITLTGEFVEVVDIETNFSNCYTDPPLPEFLQFGETLNVTIKANANTAFDTEQSTPNIFYYNEQINPTRKYLTVSEDKQTATGSLVLQDDWSNLSVNAQAYPLEVVGQQYGAINVYLVTLDDLEQFSTKRFVKGKEVDGTVIYETVDLGVYVNKIRRVYTNIGAGSTDVIRCGNYNTGVSCHQPAQDKITLDFGTAEVPAHNEDNTDYESEIQVFLPFAGFVNLNNDYAGKTISLQYVINVITGNGVAKFSYNGVVFQVVEIKPSSEIIYLSPSDTVKTIGGDEWNEMLYYGLEPYIYCKWYKGVNSGRNNDAHTCVISDLTGFNIFDDVTPIHAPEMLTEEQELIYRALSDGVYI